jgi:hypothetical protein
MERNFPGSTSLRVSNHSHLETEMKELISSSQELAHDEESIPIVMKRYSKGSLTPRLLDVQGYKG